MQLWLWISRFLDLEVEFQGSIKVKGSLLLLFQGFSSMRVPKTFQGFSKGTLENPRISRQVWGQSFQGQGIKFKGELGIMIQGLFKGNPRKFSIFKSTSRETFSRILPSLALLWVECSCTHLGQLNWSRFFFNQSDSLIVGLLCCVLGNLQRDKAFGYLMSCYSSS